MKTMILMMAINAQKPPAITPANKATMPAQMNSTTAMMKPQTKAKIHHPIGKHMQINEKISKPIKNFFIAVDFNV